MSFSQKGKVIEIGATEVVSDKFQKRNVVIEFQDGNYTKQLAAQLTQTKVTLADTIKVGNEVTIHFNLSSRLYNGKWFTGADIWKVETGAVTRSPEPEKSENLPF